MSDDFDARLRKLLTGLPAQTAPAPVRYEDITAQVYAPGRVPEDGVEFVVHLRNHQGSFLTACKLNDRPVTISGSITSCCHYHLIEEMVSRSRNYLVGLAALAEEPKPNPKSPWSNY
jgi:hypothetical protein